MPQDQIIEHAHNSYHKYISKLYSISNPKIINTITQPLTRYYFGLKNGLQAPGKIHPNSEKIYTWGPEALKMIVKYATYIGKNSGEPNAEQLATLTAMCNALQKAEYSDVLKIYDANFSDQDWERARTYFATHPDAVYAGSANDLMYSYIKSAEKISRRSANLGFGTYGKTKSANTEQTAAKKSAIKRQIKKPFDKYLDVEKINFANKLLNAHKQELARQIDMGNAHKPEVRALDATLRKFSDVNTQYQSIIDELNWLPRLQKEAKFNYDLQVATSDLIIRKNPDGTIYKVYQEMHNIGPTLETYLKTHAPSDAERLELAIKLLLLTDDLHTGKLSRTGKPYAHRDIKEPNILIDEDDNLHFIDFGFTIDSEFNVEHIATQGTPEYLPISFKQENTHLAFKAFNELRVETTPSFFFDDKVAVLRTIYSQAFGDGIFTEQMFDNLPDAIWKLICSHNIPYLKHVSSKNTLKFIATALIIYECVPEICTKEILEDLSHNLSQQEEIIRDYTKTRENSRGKDLATIQKLLLDKKVFLDYLPYNYRIRTNMEPSYLQFLLENSLLTSNSMLLLSKKLNSILYKNHLERSLVLAVLNDQDFLTMHLQEATLEDINSLLGSIYNEQILSADELLDLHVEAFALNKIVPALIGTANISEVFYRLVHKSIFTNEIKDANFLEKHCDIFAFDSSDKIEFNVEQAKLILEQTQILKPHIPSDPNLRTSTDQFIQKFLNLSARYCNDLDSLPSDKESPEYADIKIAFAFIIRIHMAINELENEKINETEFADKIDSIGIIYEHEVKNNPSIKELFDPKYAQQRISPVSVTTQGIFDVSHAPSKHSHSKDAADDSTYAPKTRPDKK